MAITAGGALPLICPEGGAVAQLGVRMNEDQRGNLRPAGAQQIPVRAPPR
jgi:hypothetical protein